MDTVRNDFLDYLKGVAIILVVVGHSFQYFYLDWEPVYLPIRIFHMPFFMVLSAYFIQRSCVKSTLSEYCKKKFIRLGYPVLSWGVLSAMLHGGGGKIIQHKEIDFAQSIIGIFYANWFLSVLFIFSILAAVIYRYARKCPNFCWGVLILAFYAIPSIWYIGNCKWLLPFFVIAIQFSYYDWSDVKLSLLTPSVYVFAVCYIMFVKDHSLVSVKDFECTLPYHLNIIVRTLAGTAGSVLAICMAKIVYRCGCNKLCKYIEKLGSMSLPIYVVHTQICDLNQVIDFRFGSIFIVFFIAVLLILISICFYNICSCCSHLKLFLFGENLTR